MNTSAVTEIASVSSREASKWNVANLLTTARLVLSLWLHYRTWLSWTITWMDVGIVVVAGLTDLFDGKLARRFGVETKFGKVYDKVTDKILIVPFFVFVCCLILSMTWGYDVLSAAVSLAFGGIALIDLLIFLVGIILAIWGVRFSSSQDGRIKMTCECIAGSLFTLLFLIRPFGWTVNHPVPLLILAAALVPTAYFTYKSARGYYYDAIPSFKSLGRRIMRYLGL